MANMVAPSEEEKLWEKRGFDSLSQAISIMLAVSVIFLSKFFYVLYLSSLIPLFLSADHYRGHLGIPGLPEAP